MLIPLALAFSIQAKQENSVGATAVVSDGVRYVIPCSFGQSERTYVWPPVLGKELRWSSSLHFSVQK